MDYLVITVIVVVVLLILVFLLYWMFSSMKGGLTVGLTQESEAKTSLSAPANVKALKFKHTSNNVHLSQYHVLASWNSACSGKFVSTQQIQNVLATGCRFLDFPVTDVGGTPSICSPHFTNNVHQNSVTLSQALTTCNATAFHRIMSINYGNTNRGKKSRGHSHTVHLENHSDPLFILIRLRPVAKHAHFSPDYLNTIHDNIRDVFRHKLYKSGKKDLLDTPIKQLSGQVIIIIDATNLNAQDFEKSSLKNVANLVVGNVDGVMAYPFRTLLESEKQNIPPHSAKKVDEDTAFYPVTQFTMALPDPAGTTPSIKHVIDLAVFHNVQFFPIAFYSSRDDGLFAEYLKIFQTEGSAFVRIKKLYDSIVQNSQQAVMR